MVLPTDENIVTVTTLAVFLLPQPLRDARQMAARQRPRKLDFLNTLVRTISPTKSRGADLALTLALPSLAKPWSIFHKSAASPQPLESPADGEAESRLRFKIIQPPRIILDILEQRSYLPSILTK